MFKVKRNISLIIFLIFLIVASCGIFLCYSSTIKTFATVEQNEEIIIKDKRIAEYFLEDYPNVKYTLEYSIDKDEVTIYNPLNRFVWVSSVTDDGDNFVRFTGNVITLNISDFYDYNRNYDYKINFSYVCLSENGSTHEGDDSTDIVINNLANTYVVYFEETPSYEVVINYKLYDGTPSVFNVKLPEDFIVDETSVKLPNIAGYKFIGYEDNGPPSFNFVYADNLVFTAKYEPTSDIDDEKELKGTFHFSYLENLGDTTFATEKTATLDTVGQYDDDRFLVFSDLPFSPDNVLISDFLGWEYIYTSNDIHYVRALYSSLNFRAYDSKGNGFDYNISLTNFDAYYTNMYYNETTYSKTQVWEFFQSTLPYDIKDYDVLSSDELYGYFFFSSIPEVYGLSELIAQFTNTTWDGLIMLDAYDTTYYRGTIFNLIVHGDTWTPYVNWYEMKTGINLEDYWGAFQMSWGKTATTYHYYFYADCTTSEIYIGRNGATDYNDDTSRVEKAYEALKDKIKNIVNKGKDVLKIIGYIAAAVAGIILIVLIVRFISWVFNGFKKTSKKN